MPCYYAEVQSVCLLTVASTSITENCQILAITNFMLLTLAEDLNVMNMI